jgi:simple sugar transport system ATP-binding protein
MEDVMEKVPAICMEKITKSFGSVVANEEIDLKVYNGEIHALLGENGAGKSTLMNMLSGIYRPDSGSIFIGGEEISFASPKEAIARGIGMIHQHFKLVDVMTTTDNIIMGQKEKYFLPRKKLFARITEISEKYGLDVDPEKKVYEMSVSEKQTLEIVKVLYRGAKILIMDEPTAVLTPQEIKQLFQIMRNMKEQGCAVVIITHKLNEVMEISDRVTVLRHGKSIDTVNTKEVSALELIEKMVGRKVDLKIKRTKVKEQKKLLEFEDVTIRDNDKQALLDHVNFTVNSSEILGIAGVAGSGQKEICEAIGGLISTESGKVIFEGENIVGKKPHEIYRMGIHMGFVPEDRLGMGLVASMDIIHNIILRDYKSQKGFILKRLPGIERSKRIVEDLEVLTPNITTPVSRLSGGNIQKVLLGREIDSGPKLLITAYPVRGLDIGASYKIYDLLNDQKKSGTGVVFVGEDLDVLLELCDRILVLSDGKVSGIVKAEETTKEELGFMMAMGVEGGAAS